MEEITLSNKKLKITILPYGGIIKELWYNNVNVVVGKEKPKDYLDNPYSLGACIGRFAGRLSPYTINKKKYLTNNIKEFQLHSGEKGWSKVIWSVKEISNKENPFIILEHQCDETSNDYPGQVNVSIKYSLNDTTLCIDYKATTSHKTPINITNHSYFNLSGTPNLEDHELKINSDKVLELDEQLLPTGNYIDVKHTDFDRNEIRPIGRSRYDDCFVLKKSDSIKATLKAKSSKIKMDVYTDQPGVVIFNPNHINGICFETQKFSNAPNISHFPNTILSPGEEYIQKTKYSFSKF